MDRPPIVTPDWAHELEPDEAGPFGRAWRGQLAADAEETPQLEAWIDTWIMYVPGSHPFWTWYGMECIHLRGGIVGLPEPVLHFPGAAYELLVLSLNPEFPAPHPHRIGAKGNPVHRLSPPDHAVQFPRPRGGDDDAREITGLFAKAVVTGVLVPDSDYRQTWREVMAKTIEHYTTGHPELN